MLRQIEATGNSETVRRMLQLMGCVFRNAVATAQLPSEPNLYLRGALTAPQPKHHGAIIEASYAGESI